MRYPRSQCDHAATTKNGLKNHVKIKHKGDRLKGVIYYWSQCNYIRNTTRNLKIPFKNKHEGV